MTRLLPEPFPDPNDPACIDQIESRIVEQLKREEEPGAAYLDLVQKLADRALGGIDLPQTRVALLALARGYGNEGRCRRDLISVSKDKLPAIIACIRRMKEETDRAIPGHRPRYSTGTFGDIVEALAEVVWRTTFYPDNSGKEAVAELLPDLVTIFPGLSSNLVMIMLADHPRCDEAIAKVMTSQMKAGKAGQKGLTTLAHSLFSLYATRDDPMFKAAPKVMKLLPDPLPIDDKEARRIFVEEPLGIEPTTAAEEIARCREYIKWSRAEAEGTAPIRPNSLLPPSLVASSAQDRIAGYEAQIARLETDFEGWVREKRDAAVLRLVVAKPALRSYETLAKKAGPLTRALIESLLAEGAAKESRPRTFAIPSPPDTAFRDFGFKLLVIEELMFVQDVLIPKLDLNTFAREHTERHIDRETDGYDVIPEIRKYLEALPIAPDALALVTRLHQSSGMDGGAGVYDALWPFFDPGCGDEPIAVTDQAVHDLALVPNLSKISGLENSQPGPKLLTALAAKGVVLIDEETATFRKNRDDRKASW
ncbi:DUF6892 domain-containing protein [Roseinatronobacter alkalisoli]|uniref:DUF6892 domain-containing protein n=1 Tax=Roseinatronobacter alkalisoli TaxID=3028235 RepID=A0ABT5T7Q8_9RHOB|nr:hypothetical protein [Roseinatronobacter sp. HJB301]MDD7970232.1 hypothetical protein [Roseinatronobacter sp. HJB301]